MYEMDIFHKIFDDVLSGDLVESRLGKICEVINYQMQFPPFVRFMNFDARKLSLKYIRAELRWYLKGDPYDHSIGKYAITWNNIHQPDGAINSNYGYYLFNKYPKGFLFCLHELLKDQNSRRAVCPILASEHLVHASPDIPCTGYIQFLIRQHKLVLIVNMRSQDVIYGLGNDLPVWSMIQEILLKLLQEVYFDLEMGPVIFNAGSLHVYSEHFEMLHKMRFDSTFKPITIPHISSADEAAILLNPTLLTSTFEEIKFYDWLYSSTD